MKEESKNKNNENEVSEDKLSELNKDLDSVLQETTYDIEINSNIKIKIADEEYKEDEIPSINKSLNSKIKKAKNLIKDVEDIINE